MSMKQVTIETVTSTLGAGKDYLLAMAVGVGVEQATGYPGIVWVAMLIGAIMIRKIPEGGFRREGLMRTVWRSSIAVAVAFVFTGAIAKKLGLDEPEYMMLIGATVAGSSETFIEWIRNPSRFLSVFRNGRPK